MTKIVYKIGNCLDVKAGVLAHACNTEAVMGSGVALYLAKKYPQAESSYKSYLFNIEKDIRAKLLDFLEAPLETIEEKIKAYSRKASLGGVDFVEINPELEIANMITQYLEDRFNGKPTSLEAIESCLKNLNSRLNSRKEKGLSTELHMPLICAVRGGVDWTITRAMIEHYITAASSITVWILSQEAKKFEEKGWVHFTSYQEDLI